MVGVPYLCWLILTIEDHINDISVAQSAVQCDAGTRRALWVLSVPQPRMPVLCVLRFGWQTWRATERQC